MILPDNPIKNKENDQLKRAPLAEKVADLIRKFEGDQSFVIGIEGTWGSGKTSFVNMVLNDLSKKDDCIIVNFNPWNFSGQNELIIDFFSTLLEQIEKEVGKDHFKTIKSYASKLGSSISPSIGVGVASISLGNLWSFKEESLNEERKEIDKKLKTLTRKIVIVIDDLDRLDKAETRLIMKLVKITANFPNTIFLLAYDRNRVAERLCEDGWPGEEYLKKIVQVSFTLPEPDAQSLRRILFKDLDETIQGVYGNTDLQPEEEKHWNDVLYAGFGDLFKTIRDINRYINSLRVNWSAVSKEDVNKVDFIAIEAIRVFAPRFYSAISANRSLFTGLSSLYVGFNTTEDEKAKVARYEELLGVVPREISDQIKKISEVLFPQLDFRSHYGSDWDIKWREDHRICADERFGFYFQLGIPEGAVSESEIVNLIKTLDSEKNFSDNILRFSKENKLRPILSKILDRIDKLSEDQIKILILAFWNLEKEIDEERTIMFDFDEVDTQVSRIVYQSLLRVIPKDKRVDFVKEIVEKSKTIYYPTKFISLLIDINKKYGDQSDQNILTAEELEKIKPLLIKRINDMSSNGSLPKEEHFVFILYRWKEWEGEEKIKKYIEGLIKEKTGLLALLRGFVGRVLSTAGNYKRISKKEIEPLYPVQSIEDLVVGITDDDLKGMSDKDKEAVNLFRNPPKNDW